MDKNFFANILHGLASVLHTVVSESAIDPATKQPLVDQLADIKSNLTTGLTDAPANVGNEAQTLAADGVQLVEKTAPGPVADLASMFGPELEGLANVIASTVASKVETTFVEHNKNTIATILGALPDKATSGAA